MTEQWLVDWLSAYLRDAGACVTTEVPVGSGRADLVVEAEHVAAIEVKAEGDRQALCTALGQALLYREAGYERTAVAVPFGSVRHQEIAGLYEKQGVQLLYLEPQGFSAIQPWFPYVYGTSSGMPWGKVYRPHAHVGRVRLARKANSPGCVSDAEFRRIAAMLRKAGERMTL